MPDLSLVPSYGRAHASRRWLRHTICSVTVIVALIGLCAIHRLSVTGAFSTQPQPAVELIEQPQIAGPYEAGRRMPKHHIGLAAWLWWPFGLYLFWAQATVCDKYFVPAVEACVDTFKIPEDVAGATLMAFGCNGPELAVNVISIFITKSQVGVGTIVGSDVFNLLVIAGLSAFVAPTAEERDRRRLPAAKFNASRMCRDVTFYALSIVLLLLVMWNGTVTAGKAAILAFMAGVYAGAVASWSKLDSYVGGVEQAPPHQADIPNDVSLVGTGDGGFPLASQLESGPGIAGSTVENLSGQEMLVRGLTLEVRKGDRSGRFEIRTGKKDFAPAELHLDETAGTLSISPGSASSTNDISIDFLQQCATDVIESLQADVSRARDLLMVDRASIKISLNDVRKCEADEGNVFHLEYRGSHTPDMSTAMNQQTGVGVLYSTLEFRAASREEKEKCVAILSRSQAPATNHSSEAVPERSEHQQAVDALDPSNQSSVRDHLVSVLSWFCFPVLLLLELTIPKCFFPSTRKLWPFTFSVSMFWLAFFSYWICVMADKVHEHWGIKENFLGLTLAAVGTSFPNCVASVIVAKEGKGNMAIANALGSNIQNVFLALGIPWLANALVSGGHFEQSTKGIVSAVASMAISLALFIFFLGFGRCEFGKVAASSFIVAYALFVLMCIFNAYD